MRRIVGDDSWKQVKTIFTDGDKAMSKAIRVQMPHVFHCRCIFHLKMNIRQNLTKVMSDADVESYIADWILLFASNEMKRNSSNKRSDSQQNIQHQSII